MSLRANPPANCDAQIHIVHYVWGFHTGGLENGIVNLINALPQQQYRHSIICQKGHDPHFFARIKQTNTKIYHLDKQDGLDVGLFWRLFKLLRQLKPDVFHSRNLSTMEGQICAALLQIPLRIHGEHGWDTNDLAGTNRKYQRLRRLLKPLVHRFVALSSEAESYLTEKIGVPAERIHRICNGVDLTRFTQQKTSPEQPEQASPIQCSADDMVFGTVGRMAVVKNQQLLLEAFLLLWQQYPAWQTRLKLLLVGDGSERAALERRADNAGIAKAVLFAGNRSDVPALMAQMDIFVLPSLAEGISNTILEAMAAGLPVIASKVGGNPELLLPSHQNSHLFDSNNAAQLCFAMSQYLLDPEKQRIDSELVKKHCQINFSLDTMVAKYHHLYQSVRKKELS
jgi:sugar transferase (PEP-CTERM/EpsH1 system associated)